jgi:hypothetical protein
MSLFGKWVASWYSGLAFNKFARKNTRMVLVCLRKPSGWILEVLG